MRLRRAAAALALVLAGALGYFLFWPVPRPTDPDGWLAAAGLRPHYATVEGMRVRYVRAGQGPTVVLIHGFASSLYTWKDILPALARGHDVIALDLPGFGGSDIPRPLRPAALARVVPGLLAQLGVTRASVAGNSLGGALALKLAAEHPDRVERIALLDSAGYNFEMKDRPPLLRFLAGLPSPVFLERPGPIRRLTALGLQQVFHEDRLVTGEKIDAYVAPLLRPGSVQAQRDLLSGGDALGFPDVIGRVKAQALVIWGREDRWIPVEHAYRFGKALPGARVVVLDGCGHMPQEERPEETVRLLGEWLAEAAAPVQQGLKPAVY